jgi:Bacteriophage tail sheath protein
MAVQVSYPGVYIDEFAPGAPIQGVGTSTAAFIGVALRGTVDVPEKVTSWDQFLATFGPDPAPGFFLWHAVRGYFANGGQTCYIVRASNGTYSQLDIPDRQGTPKTVMTVRASQPGAQAVTIKIDVTHTLTGASLYRPTSSLTGPVAGRTASVTVGQAGRFQPGDWITIKNAGEQAQVVRISGDDLILDRALTGAYAATDGVRLAPAGPGTRTFRIDPPSPLPASALAEGTVLTIGTGAGADTLVVDSVQTEYLPGPKTTYRVTFRSGSTAPVSMTANVAVQSEEFDLTVTAPAGSPPYAGLSLVAGHPRYVLDVINGDPDAIISVTLANPPPVSRLPDALPAKMSATALVTGKAENLSTIADIDFTRSLDTLAAVDDVNLVAVPDARSAAVQQAVIAHCELLGDRFGVLDAGPGLPPFGASASVEAQRRTVDSARGYAALYYPWLSVPPVLRGEPVLVPPSGHICGVIARSDGRVGVHKAPANEFVNSALGIERPMSDIDHGLLNLQGINVIRVFSGGRPNVFGARTTATDRNWQYVNIRRLFLYLEESIQEGIRWAVFEPNNLSLWQKLRRSITDFLTVAWRDGALFGAKAEDAFYVRIDEVLNPFSEQQLGRLHIEIGVRPTYPAEFIVVRIGIWAGGSTVSE